MASERQEELKKTIKVEKMQFNDGFSSYIEYYALCQNNLFLTRISEATVELIDLSSGNQRPLKEALSLS